MSKVGEREPVHVKSKQGRPLFFAILAIIVLLFVLFLVLKPRGGQAGPPANSSHSN